jgi:hypothetical protein
MSSTESETTPIPSEGQPTEKIDRRKIKRAPWRTIENEDGTTKYNDKPNDPEYFKKYYHSKRKFIVNNKINCEYCNKLTYQRHYERHQQRKSCIEAKNKMMQNLVQ